MFERFTEEARQVVVRAQVEADELGHNFIGTEHLLLGLASDTEGVAGRALTSLGVSAERLRRFVCLEVGPDRPLDQDALAAIGIDLDEVRRRVEASFGPGALERTRAGKRLCFSGARPFTPRAKKALELSLRESVARKDGYIGSEHILLGVVREGEGLAVELLRRCGAGADQIRAAIQNQLAPLGGAS